MLPPGHIAAGFLTAKVLLHFVQPNITAGQTNQLLLWGMFWGFAPDLDYFRVFAHERAFIVKDAEKNDHRKYLSHAPLLWLLAGLAVYFLSASPYFKMFGLLIWLGSWSHFVLDSIEYGIMWLWPFDEKRYTLKPIQLVAIKADGFFPYWLEFVKLYTKAISFYLEILIIVLSLIIYFR